MSACKTITNDVFDAVHELHDKGLTNRRIAILLNCSETTVSRLLRCKTLESYKNYDYDDERKLLHGKKEEQKNVQTPVYASYSQMERMNNVLDSILAILKKCLEV